MKKDIAMLIKMTVIAMSAGCLLACSSSSAKEHPAPAAASSQNALQSNGEQAQADSKKSLPVTEHRRFKRRSLPLH